MNSCKRTLVNRLGTIVLSLVLSFEVSAQTLDAAKGDTLPFFKRFSFHTNTVDWVFTTPNIGIEFDLTGSPRNQFSIMFKGRYNWNTKHSINPRLVYNVSSFAIEGRKYWRTGMGTSESAPAEKLTNYSLKDVYDTIINENGKREILVKGKTYYIDADGNKQVTRDTTVNRLRWFVRKTRNNFTSGRTLKKPRYWRAYYMGLHVGTEQFTYCWGRNGKQGNNYNFGLSGGYSIPLYPFKNGKSIDLELGVVVTAQYTRYDKFKYVEESSCYEYTGTRDWHFRPYPVLQELKLSFVYRFRSISKKVQDGHIKYGQWIKRIEEEKEIRRKSIESINERKLEEKNKKAKDKVEKEAEKNKNK